VTPSAAALSTELIVLLIVIHESYCTTIPLRAQRTVVEVTVFREARAQLSADNSRSELVPRL
jgi:hypothetical protein